MFADLHLHSSFSDGTDDPEGIVARARAANLGAIALTDHDTVEGYPRLQSACEASGLICFTGTELSCQCDGQEVHLLAYGFNPADEQLDHRLNQFQKVRQERMGEMVERLNRLGVPLELDQVRQVACCKSPGRPHVAQALVKGGFCASLEEAFERFLKKGGPAWVPKCKIDAAEAIALVHEAGGIGSVAHPGLSMVDHLFPQLMEFGLDGLECFHSKHTPVMTGRYLQVAAERGLLVTGGSDCHGLNKKRAFLGTVRLPEEHLEALLKRLNRREVLAAALSSREPRDGESLPSPIPQIVH